MTQGIQQLRGLRRRSLAPCNSDRLIVLHIFSPCGPTFTSHLSGSSTVQPSSTKQEPLDRNYKIISTPMMRMYPRARWHTDVMSYPSNQSNCLHYDLTKFKKMLTHHPSSFLFFKILPFCSPWFTKTTCVFFLLVTTLAPDALMILSAHEI